MAELSSSLLKKFINLTSEEKESTGYYSYATAIVDGGEKYVQLDGSDTVTSVSLATDLATGDRVLVYIENHQASVIGNITYPASGRAVVEINEALLDFEELTVGDLAAINAEIEYIHSNYVETEYLAANYVLTEYLVSNYVMADVIESTYATIDNLEALEAYVYSLEASEITVEYLEANYANITNFKALEGYVYDLAAEMITTDYLEANYATIFDLRSAVASIDVLNADVANISNLLAGNAGTGTLDTIILTADNATIDYAVIVNAVADTLLADLITAEYINTNQITIMSEDGGITIIGNQVQVVNGQFIFYDENGNVMMQIGQDASGAFSFILYDETGTGIMIDSEGVHESAIPDGLIVDSMVATDAAIQGSKLDIASVAQCLTEDGSLEVSSSQVLINDTTLSAWYTTVTEQLDEMSGLATEGLVNTTPYFCLWISDTEAPPDDEDLTPAICGEAICGLTICGITDGSFWVPYDLSITDNLYKWVKWKGYYADGHEEWGIPYCLTDGYLKEQTSVLQTQLEVVQGEITAKVWMSDITEAIDVSISDVWAEINIQLGLINEQVGDIFYDVYSITEQIASLTLTSNEITSSVKNIEQRLESLDGVKDFTCYFCLWISDTEAPPDDEDLTPAICGEAICGLTICGITDGSFWTSAEPVDSDGLYKWYKYLVEYDDGTFGWVGPYCMTDGYSRDQLESLYSEIIGAYSVIDQTSDSITMQVVDMGRYVDEALSGVEELNDSLDSYYEVMQTTFEQLSDSFNLTISNTIETMQETADGMQNQLDEYATYFQFTRDGLSIGELNSPFAMLLGATQLSFTESGEIMAYFSNSMLYVYDVQILNTLRIGNFRWQPGSNGNLNLVRVGEVAE